MYLKSWLKSMQELLILELNLLSSWQKNKIQQVKNWWLPLDLSENWDYNATQNPKVWIDYREAQLKSIYLDQKEMAS